MKKNELIKLIRSAVRAELNESLPKMLSELIKTESVTDAVDDPVELTKSVLNNTLQENTKSSLPTKRYSRNEALNKVLNETVGGIPAEAPRVGESSTMTDLSGNQVNVESLPDHVSKALTRNYSDVVKLVDQKRGKLK